MRLGEWFLKKSAELRELPPLMKLWKDIIKVPLIPYDVSERRAKLAHAFAELKPYVEQHEKAAEVPRLQDGELITNESDVPF